MEERHSWHFPPCHLPFTFLPLSLSLPGKFWLSGRGAISFVSLCQKCHSSVFAASFPDSYDISTVLREHTNGTALMWASFHSLARPGLIACYWWKWTLGKDQLICGLSLQWIELFCLQEGEERKYKVRWSQYGPPVSVHGFVWILDAFLQALSSWQCPIPQCSTGKSLPSRKGAAPSFSLLCFQWIGHTF